MAGSKPFVDVSKYFLFVKCSFLMVLPFVIVVAVMGHRKYELILLKIIVRNIVADVVMM